MKILSKDEIKKIEDYIERVYGTKINLSKYLVLMSGSKEKIWLCNKEIANLPIENWRVNSVGLYFGRFDRGKLRLSIEGAMMINAKKNLATIKDWKKFVTGFDVENFECKECEENQYVIVKYGKDTLGIAKYVNKKLMNVLPKGRKIKKLS